MQIAHASGKPATDILFDTLKEIVRLNLFYKCARPRYSHFPLSMTIIGAITCLRRFPQLNCGPRWYASEIRGVSIRR